MHLTRSGSRHRRPAGRRTSAIALGRGLGALLSATLLVGFGYGWYEYRSLRSGVQRFDLHNLGQAPAGSSNGPTAHGLGHDENILLAGLDSRDGLSPRERRQLHVGNDQSLSTDTVMVLHVPAGGKRATMISLPRDAYVDIQGYAKNKLNAAYADAYSDAAQHGASHEQAERAGADLLIKTVSAFTGLRIDHYVQVGFGGFYTIAKALKTVPVNLCAATDDTFEHNRITHQGGGSGFDMSAGHHDLTPVQALEFVRQRHNIKGGDLAREKRQRYFITAAFSRIASAHVLLDPGRLNSLIKAVHGALFLDKHFDLMGFADQLVDLSADKISGFTIPSRGSRNVSIVGTTENVVIVDPVTVQRAIQLRLNPPAPTSDQPAPTSPITTPAGGATHAPAVRAGCIY